MNIYHPAKDVNHIMYRILSIMFYSAPPLEVDRLRVLSFYYVFPQFIKLIKPWPSDIKEFKKCAVSVEDGFEYVGNLKKVYYEMMPSFDYAISILAAKGIVSVDVLKKGEVFIDFTMVPREIIDLIRKDSFNKSDVFELIAGGLGCTPFEGFKGLKARSGLMEYRYD